MINIDTLQKNSRPFLAWAADWYNQLERIPLDSIIKQANQTAILAVDMLNGFCYQGPLASERVASTVQPVVKLFKAAHKRGVQHFVLPQEDHPADAVEFESYGPHCISGTSEAQTIPELTELPFSDQFVIIPKNSVNPFVDTELEAWLEAHPQIDTFIVVGDCTDICTYHLAINLKLRANAKQLREIRVVVPVEGIQTYDLPVEIAQQIGAVPHDGDLLHLIFLYSMMLNGVQIVASIDR